MPKYSPGRISGRLGGVAAPPGTDPRAPEAANPPKSTGAFRAALATSYLLIGILGFAVSGFEAFAASSGDRLVFFGINPLQNLIHLLLGGLALSRARRNWFVAGALMLLLGVGRGFGILGSNLAADIFHLLTGVIFLVWSGRYRSASARGPEFA